MPELPEVEVCRRSLLEPLAGRHIVHAVFLTPKLRQPLTRSLADSLAGLRISSIDRRGKYLIFHCSDNDFLPRSIIVHLGMSGSLKIAPLGTPPRKHDHIDLVFEHAILRLHDPRRFGLLCLHEGSPVENHPLRAKLGIEPLSAGFDDQKLFAMTRKRTTPVKPFLMDAHRIVGVGNIYASESLFLSRISPRRTARSLSFAECRLLVENIKTILLKSIAAGGSSIRNYVHSDGSTGSFQTGYAVYGREGQPCTACNTLIKTIRQGGRSTFFCDTCQN